MSTTILDAFEQARRAADVIATAFHGTHDLIAVLGSGWADSTSMLGDGPELSVADIPGFMARITALCPSIQILADVRRIFSSSMPFSKRKGCK